MRRRKFVASGEGLIVAAAGQGIVGTFSGSGLRAQPAPAPAAMRNPPQGKWIRLAPFPQATGELLGVAINGKLYAAQGLLPGFKPAGFVYQYDPASDAWAEAMPHPVHHAAVTALNGKYLFGLDLPVSGPPGWNPVNDAWEYDPATDTWRALAPMPTTRRRSRRRGWWEVLRDWRRRTGARPSAPVIPRASRRSLATVEEYDPATNTWRDVPRCRRRATTGCEAVNGKIYVIGGRLSGAFIIGLPGNINLVQATSGSGRLRPKPHADGRSGSTRHR